MIWCVEDDADIRDIEMYALQSAGFQVRGFERGDTFWEELQLQQPELILLDIMLPGIDGIELLSKLKETPTLAHLPVILATAKGQEFDRIRGLELGADDYIVKPFSMMEMVSRVKAVLRRTKSSSSSSLLRVKGLILNLEEHIVTCDGKRIPLTFKEFELLRIFLSHPGKVYTREQLFSLVWKQEYMTDSRTLDSHIRTLRAKLEHYGSLIHTVRNVGYRLEVEDIDKKNI